VADIDGYYCYYLPKARRFHSIVNTCHVFKTHLFIRGLVLVMVYGALVFPRVSWMKTQIHIVNVQKERDS
jgi:uncharacterized membrane protein SirB2